MQRKQRGFGLGLGASVIQNPVALLLIGGVFGWIAWNSWSDYTAAQRIREGITLAAQAQAAIAKAHADKGPADFSVPGAAGWTPPAPGENVRSISIAKNGTITVRYTAAAAEEGKNEIQSVPMDDLRRLDLSSPASKGKRFTWECGTREGKSTVPEAHRPGCR